MTGLLSIPGILDLLAYSVLDLDAFSVLSFGGGVAREM